jgi:hypothetical protein
MNAVMITRHMRKWAGYQDDACHGCTHTSSHTHHDTCDVSASAIVGNALAYSCAVQAGTVPLERRRAMRCLLSEADDNRQFSRSSLQRLLKGLSKVSLLQGLDLRRV